MVGILLIAIFSFYFILWLFLVLKSKRARKKIYKAEQNSQHEIRIAQLRTEEEQAERKRIHAKRVAREEQEAQAAHALELEKLKLQQEAQRKQELEAIENRKKLKSQLAEVFRKQEADEAKKKLAYKQELEKEKTRQELALKEEQLNERRRLEREAVEFRAKQEKRQLELEEADAQAKLLEQKIIKAKKRGPTRKQAGRLINTNELTSVELEAAINEAINQELLEAEFYKSNYDEYQYELIELDDEALEVAIGEAIIQKLLEPEFYKFDEISFAEAPELDDKALESELADALELEALALAFEAENAGGNSIIEYVNPSRLSIRTPEALLQKLLPSIEAQKTNWLEFQRLLKKHNISRLYHFTDQENLVSIRASGGLLSWYSCKENGISIARPGGSEFSWHLDTNKGLADYVRLSFIPDHPMMYIARGDGRIKSPIVLEIDPVVIFLQQTKFSSMNAAKSGVFAAGSLEKFSELKFNVFRKRYFDLTEDERPYYQAEVLIHKMLPAKYILNLNRIPV